MTFQLPREDDPGYASDKAIIAMQHAGASLPGLQRLRLVDSPIQPRDMGALAAALAAFSVSLQHLGIDTWLVHASHLRDSDGAIEASNTRRCQRHVFGAISHMQQLATLSIRDWMVLTGDGFHEAPALRRLPKLGRIRVGRFPCSQCLECQQGGCGHFPRGLPFEQIAEEQVLEIAATF